MEINKIKVEIQDQICALEWIHNNIKNFRGDPNNVCIFGESGGGCAVSILPLIKETKGLYFIMVLHKVLHINLQNQQKIKKINDKC